jgi:Ca2+-binding EF-hand superfamily protein
MNRLIPDFLVFLVLVTVPVNLAMAQAGYGIAPPQEATTPDFYGTNIFERNLFGRIQPQRPGAAAHQYGTVTRWMAQNQLLLALDLNRDLQISAEEVERATSSLLALDANNDGVLSGDEIQPGLSRLLTAKNAANDIRDRARQRAQQPSPKQQFIQQMVGSFMKFDSNEDGEISADELPENLRSYLEKADADSDGTLTHDELILAAEKRWSTAQFDPAKNTAPRS